MNNSIHCRKIASILISLLLLSTSITYAATIQNFLYDANGNMISDGNFCYTYNEANQLSKVTYCPSNQTIAEYKYDYTGRRAVKKQYENGTLQYTVYYVNKYFETKLYPNGTTENTSYYYLNDELVARKDPDGKKYYYHNDHLGSTTVITDEQGNLVEKTQYYPYGEVRSGGTRSKYLYTGQEKDPETGLYYYGARYYDPDLARFVQPDPVIQDVYDPQGLNRYSYVRNNPVKYVDPTGNLFFATTILETNPFILEQSALMPKPTPSPLFFGDSDFVTKPAMDSVIRPKFRPAEAVRALRNEFESRIKPQYWRDVANKAPEDYENFMDRYGIPKTAENLERMKAGDPPKAPDDTSIELHHKTSLKGGGTNDYGNLRPMQWWEHRGAGNFKGVHPELFKELFYLFFSSGGDSQIPACLEPVDPNQDQQVDSPIESNKNQGRK